MADWRAATEELEARLRQSFSRLAATAAALPAAAFDARPAPGAWSPREVLEHVTLANRYLLILADKIARKSARRNAERLAAGAALPDTVSPIEHLEQLARRDFRWVHPEHMTPHGDVGLEELRARLDAQCARACEMLARMPAGEGSLHRIRMSVVGGEDRLDLYQYLTILALHAERHAAQIASSGAAR